jgi:hypothetical protein
MSDDRYMKTVSQSPKQSEILPYDNGRSVTILLKEMAY